MSYISRATALISIFFQHMRLNWLNTETKNSWQWALISIQLHNLKFDNIDFSATPRLARAAPTAIRAVINRARCGLPVAPRRAAWREQLQLPRGIRAMTERLASSRRALRRKDEKGRQRGVEGGGQAGCVERGPRGHPRPGAHGGQRPELPNQRRHFIFQKTVWGTSIEFTIGELPGKLLILLCGNHMSPVHPQRAQK